MKLIEAMEAATQSDDVTGIQKAMMPIVRRKVPAGYTKMGKKKKKKKGKKESRET